MNDDLLPNPTLPPVEAEASARPTFEALYAVARSYLPEALRLLRVPREDVDDLVHDVVLVAYRGLDRYAPKVGAEGAPPDSRRSLKAWLSGIAWRVVARRRGRAYRRLELPQGDADEVTGSLDDALTTEQLAAATQRRRILAGVLRKLRPERAEVLLMHTFLEMSVPDIAEELGLNPNTVKSRIARARADAIAAVKRLSHDEQTALEGSPLLLPLALDRVGEPPRGLLDGLPGSPLGLAAGAAGMLAVGMALGAGLRGQVPHAAEAAPIAAAREAPLADAAARAEIPVRVRDGGDPHTPATGALDGGDPHTPGTAVSTPPVVLGAPSANPPPRPASVPGGRAAGAETRALARELVWITAARRALHQGEGDRALVALKAHEAEFPRGVLAGEREVLAEKARGLAASP